MHSLKETISRLNNTENSSSVDFHSAADNSRGRHSEKANIMQVGQRQESQSVRLQFYWRNTNKEKLGGMNSNKRVEHSEQLSPSLRSVHFKVQNVVQYNKSSWLTTIIAVQNQNSWPAIHIPYKTKCVYFSPTHFPKQENLSPKPRARSNDAIHIP
ncbi:hypothetical protein CEXT_731291 [Caerostris extrusa]|uniref:Uncharacterized protein n=1 Tax=Caerostris extrusa TaxID=172846 RepID=A0AAV4X466_CAEEX|nr:hypothetical protein CEXT_731291 [Caerostris extrusa]